MIIRKLTLLFILVVLIPSDRFYCQSDNEYNSLFKLGSTPFISQYKLNINIGYGLNYGYPSQIAKEWMIPNIKRNILFDNIKVKISFQKRFELYYNYYRGYSQAFNSCANSNGIDFQHNFSLFGFRWKFIKSSNLSPDFMAGLNFYKAPISIGIGSSRERFKYYAGLDLTFFYYIPIPYNSYLGISYEILKNINLFAEYRFETRDGGVNYLHNIKTGTMVSINDYFDIDISLFYFNFIFNNAIPFRTGCIWKDPSYVITVPAKNNYFLLSGSININLAILK